MQAKAAVLIVAMVVAYPVMISAGDWPTFGHDPQRSGWAPEEDTLSPQNVSALTLLWKLKLPNEPKSLTALTAPVVADGVAAASGTGSVVYVAGSSGSVFAVDATTGKRVWTVDLESQVLPKYPGMWLCPNDLNATPTIDKARGLLYVVGPNGMLSGLDLATGATRIGPVQFVPPYAKDWSLNLWDGIVYTPTSQGCGGARSGIYSIDVRQPARPVIRDLLVSQKGAAGIWGRGGAVIGDDGRIYASTGDGRFDPSSGDYGSSIIAAALVGLQVVDYYWPLNSARLTQYDLDVSAASPIWFPYREYGLIAGGGKEGVLYLLDAESLGTRDHQTPLLSMKLANDELAFEQQGIWGALSSWRDEQGKVWLLVPIWGPTSHAAPAFPIRNGATPHGCILAFTLSRNAATGKPVLEPAWSSGDLDVPDPAAIANGVVFVLSTGENTMQTTGASVKFTGQKLLTDKQRAEQTQNAVLYALDAKNGKVLFQSGNAITDWVHFSGLAVADGQVFVVDHSSNLYCFGLKNQP